MREKKRKREGERQRDAEKRKEEEEREVGSVLPFKQTGYCLPCMLV